MTRIFTTTTLRLCSATLGFSLLASGAVAATTVPASYFDARAAPLVYAVNGESSAVAYRESASGNVAPAILLSGARANIVNPAGLAVSPTGETAISVFNGGSPNPQQIHFYAPGASGDVAPTATIRCAGFGDSPQKVAFDLGNRTRLHYVTSVAVSRDGRIFVASSPNNTAADELVVFAKGAHGNVSPLQVIGGSNTGLSFIQQIGLRE